MPRPGRDSRSMTHTLRRIPRALSAHASPTTPPPITATSISFTCRPIRYYSVFMSAPESPAARPQGAVRAAARRRARRRSRASAIRSSSSSVPRSKASSASSKRFSAFRTPSACRRAPMRFLRRLMALGRRRGRRGRDDPVFVFRDGRLDRQAGRAPVFVDIDRATFNIDAGAIAAALTPKTKAIMPVHLFGQSADMAPIRRDCGARRHSCRRRCRAGDRRVLSRQARGRHRHDRLLLVFSDEESRRVRRRRPRHHIRRHDSLAGCARFGSMAAK